MTGLGFAAPLFLLAFLALPAIWWLLRLTPPKPQTEIFPPFQLLLNLAHSNETPAESPWWLLLLRLFIAALVILALAGPVWKPEPLPIGASGPLALVIDNGWAAAEDWNRRMRTAHTLVDEAEKGSVPVHIIATAEEDGRSNSGPLTGAEARRHLDSLSPRPIPVDRKTAFDRLAAIAGTTPGLQIAYVADGLATPADTQAFARLQNMAISPVLWYRADISRLAALCHAENTADRLIVTGVRAGSTPAATWRVTAHDLEGRRIGETRMVFADGEKNGTADFSLPLEIRNDVAFLQLEGAKNAGATWLMDTNSQRRRIAIMAPATGELAQPLLSPLYYVSRALAPYGNIIHAGSGHLTQTVDRLLAARPAVLIMGDVSAIPAEAEAELARWIADGGTLIRFAGPNLAASEKEDTLIPVRLRRGERTLGGAMSWASPQRIAPFPQASPFAGLTLPDDVTVSRQILAEPAAGLHEKSWVTLTDGTPLITATAQGKGRLVFIHTTADPGWSNLALSGFFVEMLQRIVMIANQPVTDLPAAGKQSFAPWRIVAANGGLEPAPDYIRPLILDDGREQAPAFATPPGLYGTGGIRHALNLLDRETSLAALEIPASMPVHTMSYTADAGLPLRGLAWAAAALLFALDSVIALRPRGLLRLSGKAAAPGLAAIVIAMVVFTAVTGAPAHAREKNRTTATQPATASDEAARRAGKTHLAYIITGNEETDRTSRAGLQSLASFITQMTTINPGGVFGLDPEKDELAFYPLIYWPIDADGAMPSPRAIERIDAYMHRGGTILFDTRDQITASMRLDNSATPATQRLRDILAGLDIPPLEPAPPEHVIARSFYIMPDFPGRYRGSPLWIASTPATHDNRPIRAGDGVSSILITANDFAGAWAHDERGEWLLPLVPDDNMQRVWAFRGGLNIVMYMLTGNYKADQVHAPELLKRLGR